MTKAKQKARMGTPPKYTEEIARVICRRIGDGESLNRICKDIEPKISRRVIYDWLADEKYSDFLHKYTLARAQQADTFVDQCADIADYGLNDTYKVKDKNGKEIDKPNHDHINRSRLRVDTRLKVAAMMAPRKYGVKQEITVKGSDDVIKALMAGRTRAANGKK